MDRATKRTGFTHENSSRARSRSGQSSLSSRALNPLSLAAGAFCFEAAFVLFIFAGRYKGDPRLSWTPVDFTLLFFMLSVGAAAWIMVRRNFRLYKPALPIAIGFIVFLFWMIVSLAWSPSTLYGPAKAMELSTLVLWAGLAPALVISPEPKRFNRFASAVMVLAAIMATDGLISYVTTGVIPVAEDYLGLGRLTGFATAIALVQLSAPSRWPKKATLAALLLLYSFVLWTAGGRGPFLATLASILVLVLGSIEWRSGRIRVRIVIGFLLLCVAGVVVLLWIGPESRTIQRFLTLMTHETYGHSAGTRLVFYEGSMGIIDSAPLFGHGLGAWPIRMHSTDVETHPHNIFLEIWSEGGVVGLVLFLVALWSGLGWVLVRGLYDNPIRLTVLLLFVNTFVNALTSGDLSDNRLLFATLGLMAAAAVRSARVPAAHPAFHRPPPIQA